ncbi:hypothetical protein REPUB_Repub07fG0184700 [Reevesia pubescens]
MSLKMANFGIDSTGLGEKEDGNINNWSISKLIYSLKSTFCAKDFAKVEAILVARAEKSKTEIQTLKQEKDSFLYKFEEEKMEKMSLEEELKKYKEECEEMKVAVLKLRDENMVLREMRMSAEETCNKLLEKVRRMGEKEHDMIDLRSRNCELECAKAKSEVEIKILKKRFEEFDKRVLNLESDLPLLKDQQDSRSNGIGEENGNSENWTVKLDDTVNVEEVSVGPSCDSPVRANGHSQNAGSGRPPSQNIVEIVDIDSDDDDDCAPVEILSEKRMTHPAEKSHQDQVFVENGNATPKRKRALSVDVGESENGDDDTLNEKLKMKKLQEPVCRPDNRPLNPCSTTTISSDHNEVKSGCATPNDFMVSRQREQSQSEQKCQNLMNGFPLDGLDFPEESSVSSDSDSDDDDDSVHNLLIHSPLAPEFWRENRK